MCMTTNGGSDFGAQYDNDTGVASTRDIIRAHKASVARFLDGARAAMAPDQYARVEAAAAFGTEAQVALDEFGYAPSMTPEQITQHQRALAFGRASVAEYAASLRKAR